MSEHGHCYDCGGDNGNHFDGCTYEGTGEVGGSYSFSRGGGFVTVGLMIINYLNY